MRWLAISLTPAWVASVGCSQPTEPTLSGPVTPPLVTFSGVVSDSETNTPLAGVRVSFGYYPPIGALTGADGSYQFTVDPAEASSAIMPNASRLCPHAFRADFEDRGACVPIIGNRISWSPTLQRRITVEAGQAVMSTIFRGEGSGPAGEECEPCKTVHVSVPGTSGTLVVRLMAEAAESGLRLVVPHLGFRPDDGSLPVTTERDILVYVKGAAVLPARFELSTMFRSGT